MINKDFNDLSLGEKFQLQKIMKKKRGGQELLPNEQELYNRFSEEFTESEKKSNQNGLLLFYFW